MSVEDAFTEESGLLAEDSHDSFLEDFAGDLPGHDFDTTFDADEGFNLYRLWQFMGPGFLMSIAFVDPGNLESDLQAGAYGGYSLLWVLLWSTVIGAVMQCAAIRLGVVSGKHLAQHCRGYPRAPRLVLWLMTELAIIGSDIQEVVGSAIAISLLTAGKVPLWAGVLFTAVDTLTFLSLESYGIRRLEVLFYVLILTMILAFGAEYVISAPDAAEVTAGILIPRLHSGLLTQAIGVLGAIIMPHNLFLHSALVQSRRVDHRNKGAVRQANMYYTVESSMALVCTFVINMCVVAVFAKGFHGRPDIKPEDIGLHNAGEYLERAYGKAAMYIWAVGLLAAGQSSTITGTYAGQFVMSGFLELQVPRWQRVLVTRSLAIVPAILVAVFSAQNMDKLDQLLNILQSVQLPFALVPLIRFTSDRSVMGAFVYGKAYTWFLLVLAGLTMSANFYLVVEKAHELLGCRVWLNMLVALASIVYVGFLVYVAVPGKFRNVAHY